jgi:hypothetical protein
MCSHFGHLGAEILTPKARRGGVADRYPSDYPASHLSFIAGQYFRPKYLILLVGAQGVALSQ